MTFMFNTADSFKMENGILVPYVKVGGILVPVAFAALPGSQAAFLATPEVLALYEGTRGGCGKTLALIMDFCQFVGIGMGAEHKGIILRRTFPQLAEVIGLARIYIPKIYPGAIYNEMAHVFKFPDGATLEFSHMFDRHDFERYQGRSFTWIGVEEAANFPTQDILMLLSCLRSVQPIKHFRLTTNCIGVGRDWVMEVFNLPLSAGTVIGPPIPKGPDDLPARRVIHGRIEENIPLQWADPDYMERTLASTTVQAVKDAWALGVWAPMPSSLFGDCPWECIKIPSFIVPTPEKLRCSYDWGSGAPYGVLVWWESSGEDLELADGRIVSTVRGSEYIVAEIYGGTKGVGWGESTQKTAARILNLFANRGWDTSVLRKSGNMADGQIFDKISEKPSIAEEFLKCGIVWERADKSAGTVHQGTELMRKLFLATKPDENGRRENPGLFVTDSAPNFLRTVPFLQRDDTDPEKLAKGQDDHLWDSARYHLYRDKTPAFKFGRVEFGTSPRLHGSVVR